jgi:cytochrome c peroxidase
MRRAPWIVLAALLTASRAGAQPPPPPPPLQPLPAPPVPAGNPITQAKAMLGKALFWDEQLSSTRTVACGSCHQGGSGGSDPRSRLGNAANATSPGLDGVFGTPDDVVGSPGVVLNDATGAYLWSGSFGYGTQVTPRLAPAHINAAYGPQLFWDGRASGTFADPLTGATVLANGAALESQAAGPPVASVEMAHTGRDWAQVALRVASSVPLALATNLPADVGTFIGNRGYADLFADAFGSGDVNPSRIAMAIATYERTLVSNRTPFDSTIVNTATLTPAENAGRQLFGQLPCAACHAGALMSDNQFHYIGVRPAAEDSGRMVVTHLQQNLGEMKTPSLRNVALRRSFMHDGRFHSLADVVAFYNRGGDFNAPNKDPRIVPLGLTAQQQANLVAFLGRPLIDPRVAAETAPFDRPTLFTEGDFVPTLLNGGVAGASGLPKAIALEPALAGNPAFTLAVTGVPNASAVLVVDDAVPAEGAAPANGSFARQAIVLGAHGEGSVTLALPNDPGHVLFARWYVDDPTAPGGVASSAPVRFQVFGPHGEVPQAPVAVPAAPVAARLYAGFPNPFTASTIVRYDLAQASSVDLAVYDVAGRLQRRLDARAIAVPGSYAVSWDGRDDGGRGVPAGVYFYRLVTAHGVQTARVVRIR